jgi:drug/metabolite transporter (DMT)-like permease
MNSHSHHTTPTIWLMVIVSTFFWGSNFNAGRAVAGELAPLSAAAERFLLAVAVFLLLRLWQGKAESQLRWRDAGILLALGIVGIFGFNYGFFTALQTTSALNAALIMALSPMISLVFARILLGTGIHLNQLIGILLALLGVFLVITGGQLALLHIAQGDAWMLGACSLWSLYSVAAKRYATHIPALQLARWTVSIGALALTLAALLLEQPLQALPQQHWQTHCILFYMALCGTFLAYIFWLKGVQHLGPAQSAIAYNLVPVFTLVVSLLLGRIPSGLQLLGMLVVIAGVLVANSRAFIRRRTAVAKLPL